MKAPFSPPLLASIGMSLVLVACVGGDGDDAWRTDNDGGDNGTQPAPQECALSNTAAGLTLKICDLPPGSILPITHASGSTRHDLEIQGSGIPQGVPVDAKGGDTLILGPVSVAAPQRYLVQCAFSQYRENGTLQDDGSLQFKDDLGTATQTIRCGRVRLVGTVISTARADVGQGYTLRLNLDTAQASWLLDPQGQRIQTNYLAGAYSRFAGGRQLIHINDPISGQRRNAATQGQDGDQQLLYFTNKDGVTQPRYIPGLEDSWTSGTYGYAEAMQTGNAPEVAHLYTEAAGAWQTDGTSPGSVPSSLLEVNIPGAVVTRYQLSNDKLWFQTRRTRPDGSVFLSLHFKDLATGAVTAGLENLIPLISSEGEPPVLGEKLIYRTNKNTTRPVQYDLYATDGTSEGTQQLARSGTRNGDLPGLYTKFGQHQYFRMNASQLWRTDGTPEGTEMVIDLKDYANYDAAKIAEIVATEDFLAFSAVVDSQSGTPIRALFRSDGTSAGTRTIISPSVVMPNTQSDKYNGMKLFAIGKRVIFSDDGANFTRVTNHLWSTDGTDAGTMRLFPKAEVSMTYTAAECPLTCLTSRLAVLNDRLLIRAVNLLETDKGDENRVFFWLSDGSPEGTVPVTAPDGSRFSYASFY